MAAAKRADALREAEGPTDDELRQMACAESTTRNKKSRVGLFLEWAGKRGARPPFRPRQVQMFAAYLTYMEYRRVLDYTSSVFQYLAEPPEEGEAPRLVSSPAILRNISDEEAAISRTVVNTCPTKAAPALRGPAFEKLPRAERRVAALWVLSSLRGDSLGNLQAEDVSLSEGEVALRVREDKVRNQRGRTIRIGCNCSPGAPGNAYCPIHLGVGKEDFPIGVRGAAELAKKLGLTMHSMRRGFALSARAEQEAGRKIDAGALCHHAGWESSSRMWAEYTSDWANWDGEKGFFPLEGAIAAIEKHGERATGTQYSFPKCRKTTTEAREIFVTAAKKLARKGRVGAARKTTVKVKRAREEESDGSASDPKVGRRRGSEGTASGSGNLPLTAEWLRGGTGAPKL